MSPMLSFMTSYSSIILIDEDRKIFRVLYSNMIANNFALSSTTTSTRMIKFKKAV